jgi:hypothetical protein
MASPFLMAAYVALNHPQKERWKVASFLQHFCVVIFENASVFCPKPTRFLVLKKPRNTLQHTATPRNTLQHPATPCNTLQHTYEEHTKTVK